MKNTRQYIEVQVQTAVDDRRHDTVDRDNDVVTHLAVAMSARDVYDAVKERCPEKTPYHPCNGCGSSSAT